MKTTCFYLKFPHILWGRCTVFTSVVRSLSNATRWTEWESLWFMICPCIQWQFRHNFCFLLGIGGKRRRAMDLVDRRVVGWFWGFPGEGWVQPRPTSLRGASRMLVMGPRMREGWVAYFASCLDKTAVVWMVASQSRSACPAAMASCSYLYN